MAESPLNVEVATDNVPEFEIPPPPLAGSSYPLLSPVAELPPNVQLATNSVPESRSRPPCQCRSRQSHRRRRPWPS